MSDRAARPRTNDPAAASANERECPPIDRARTVGRMSDPATAAPATSAVARSNSGSHELAVPHRGRKKTIIRLAVAAAGFATLAVIARGLDLHAVGDAIRDIDPALGIAAALVMIGAKLGAKVVRSQILLTAASKRIAAQPPGWWLTARLLAASHA